MMLNSRGDVSSPNRLIIANSSIFNIFYDMNSLVNLTQYGGNVTFFNTSFQRITLCGGLIKNYAAPMPSPDFSLITNQTIQSKTQISFLVKMRRI
jgi:hypothetical protein